jgi:hypothetical protein
MPGEKIEFVNGRTADCGCQMDFSNGGGEYSDVHRITPCSTHAVKPFGPVEVRRDENGWWHHPGIPDFGSREDPAPYKAWAAEQDLELKTSAMEVDLAFHPYWDGAAHCNSWDPQSPGPEWFLMGIFDTEDGPHVQWARRVVKS